MGITFNNSNTSFRIKNKLQLKDWINLTILEYCNPKKIAINYIFCTDKELLKINIDYLNHDYYTDIITFDLSDNNNSIEADIFVSYETVLNNSVKLKTGFNNEMCRVVIHGVLHLVGFNDKKLIDKKEMTIAENKCLKNLFHVKHSDYFSVIVSRGTNKNAK